MSHSIITPMKVDLSSDLLLIGDKLGGDSRDELDLRDEILELKRELAAVRKDKDKLSIKLRKSEEEIRKKDKQIEHLMDPTQNSEIRRLLSVKGASLLLNLKDQNNTLMQMLMEKNQQIRKLGGEIKTAKLYSRSSKTQPYRVEISRLRSLLLQSQEALKEAAQHPSVPQVCLSGHSSTSSEDVVSPSPQELEDLRYMVQSLETHMQHSNQLLNKKNQEIAWLTRELQGAMGEHHCCRNPQLVRWKIESNREKYDRDRRCTSAPTLEPFQAKSTDIYDIQSDKRLRKKEQVASERETEKERNNFTKKQNKKRPTVREKWKFAVKKLRESETFPKKVHTNPTADDEMVWTVLRKSSLPLETTPKPAERKFSLPNRKAEELSEVIIELEDTPRKKDSLDEEKVELRRSLYRLSIDSSMDSECFEVKPIEVEVEINGRESPEDNTTGNEVFNKEGGENCFGGKDDLSFFEDDEEDDDDVVTI